MLRAGPAAPAESDPAAVPATSCESRRGVYGLAPAWSSAARAIARVEHERLDRDEMIDHGLARGAAVALRDRLHDAPMVLMRAGGASRRVDRLLATLPEQIHDRVHEAGDGAVVRRGADRRVKGRVLREPRPSGGDLARLVLEDALHLLHFLGRRAARGERGDGGLEHAARLEELADRFPLRGHHECQRADERVDRDLADERAFAGTDLDEPEALERPPRLAYGGAAHDELLGELALGRQPIAALEAPLGDELLDLPDDLLIDPRRLDRSKLDRMIVRSPRAGRAHHRLTDSPARGRGAVRGRATSRAP